MAASAHGPSGTEDRRLATVGRLAGALAHDFNNLLTAILGYAELLLDELEPGDPRRADVVEIQRSGERAASLTRQLLAFRRNADAPPQLLSWAALLEELKPLLTSIAGERVTVHVGVGRPVETLLQKSDASHVLFALALLARERLGDGGTCTFNPTGDEGQAGVDALLAGERPAAALDAAESAELERLVTAAGGRLSSSLQGATLRVSVSGPSAAGVATQPGASGGDGRAPHALVLLAEDEQMLRLLIRRMLERHGMRVVEAPDGRAALEIFERSDERFDILVTDVVMPGGMSGVDLAHAVVERRPGLGVLYISGYVDAATLDLANPAMRGAFLPKPFTRDQLVSAIDDVLRRRPPEER